MHRKIKKCLNKVKKFCQQIRQGPYFICAVCHRCLYKRGVRLFEHEKNILTAEFYCPVRSFDEKIYICHTCHKQLSKNEMPYQTFFNKMILHPIPDGLKHLKKLEIISISKRIIFKKIAIMHVKEEFAKIKGIICNIPIAAVNICNILPRPADSNGLIVVTLKRDLKYRGYVYFEPVHPNVIYQALNYLKTHNKFYEDISISEGVSSKKMINFSGTDEHQDFAESIHKKNTSFETEYASVEDPLSKHRTGSNETALVSEIPNIINDENVISEHTLSM